MTRWSESDIPNQTGRTVLITGANSGLGLRSAEALAAKGARVFMGCRNETKAAAALDEVKAVASGPPPRVVRLDLADLGAVRAAADDVAERLGAGGSLDLLMNNAGVMALPLGRSVDGFEMQFGTNHLGHFALTGLVLPLLLRAEAPRVVTTSSQMHRLGKMRWDDLNWERRRYSKWLAYCQSKLANLLFTSELNRQATEAGTKLVAAAGHPGYAATHLQAAGPEQAGKKLKARIWGGLNRAVAQSDQMGALPQLRAAMAPDVMSGECYGPSRIFQARGYPRRVGTSRAARNADAARRLWAISEDLTGVTYAWEASDRAA